MKAGGSWVAFRFVRCALAAAAEAKPTVWLLHAAMQ